MKRRIVLILLVFVLLALATACVGSSLSAPSAIRGSLVSLPFLISDAPVGVSSAEIIFDWNERQYEYAYGRYPFPYYGGTLRAEYIMQFVGEESGYVGIALPRSNMTAPNRFFYEPNADGLRVELDGERIYFVGSDNTIRVRSSYGETGNLVGSRTLILEGVIEEVRGFGGFDYPTILETQWVTTPSIVVIPVHFEPGQERVLSVSFPILAGMHWDSGLQLQQSLFHYTVLTEAAGYWDFFEELTVTTNQPEYVITSVLPQGFELVDENILQMHVYNPSENINFGFWMLDNERDLFGNFSRSLGALTVFMFWPILVFVVGIVVVIWIVHSAIKKRDSKVAVDFPMLKYCPECGGRCRDFAAFCRHCGAKFKDS